jgi:hypothetical protein
MMRNSGSGTLGSARGGTGSVATGSGVREGAFGATSISSRLPGRCGIGCSAGKGERVSSRPRPMCRPSTSSRAGARER